jgi:hypothetical protein
MNQFTRKNNAYLYKHKIYFEKIALVLSNCLPSVPISGTWEQINLLCGSSVRNAVYGPFYCAIINRGPRNLRRLGVIENTGYRSIRIRWKPHY